MALLRLALAQINVTVGALDRNARKIQKYIAEARALGAHIIIFPELAISGYPPEDLLLKPSFIRACRDSLDSAAATCHGITAVIGYPDATDDLHNSAAIISDTQIVGIYHKHYLPNYGVFDEARYFSPGREVPVFLGPGWSFGASICEDIWYQGYPVETQAVLGGAEVLINISASPYHKGKGKVRERMLAVRAQDNVAVVAFCNLVGGQDELVFDGASVVFDSSGNVLARGKQFAEDLVIVDIHPDDVLRQRLRDPRRRTAKIRLEQADGLVKRVPLSVQLPTPMMPLKNRPIEEPLSELAEVYQALVLATGDYVRKNGFQKVVIGLSGGVDSSLVACVAVDALGAEHVIGVSMPSRYSSEHSKADAAALASALDIQYLIIPIEPAFQAFLDMLAPAFSGRQPDLAEENVQARIRGTTLMALSNKFGWLVLSTGNKSEYSVGYATLYGDMAGGFAAIKDVPKTMVYSLSRYRNSLRRIIPENVLVKPPSAELRPDQKDSDSLPEYTELDEILAAYVEQDWSNIDMAVFGPATVRKIVHLVDRAEYKRRQGPPGVKITMRAFGKDRRLSITNLFAES